MTETQAPLKGRCAHSGASTARRVAGGLWHASRSRDQEVTIKSPKTSRVTLTWVNSSSVIIIANDKRGSGQFINGAEAKVFIEEI